MTLKVLAAMGRPRKTMALEDNAAASTRQNIVEEVADNRATAVRRER
jgi:hypothetical protein